MRFQSEVILHIPFIYVSIAQDNFGFRVCFDQLWREKRGRKIGNRLIENQYKYKLSRRNSRGIYLAMTKQLIPLLSPKRFSTFEFGGQCIHPKLIVWQVRHSIFHVIGLIEFQNPQSFADSYAGTWEASIFIFAVESLSIKDRAVKTSLFAYIWSLCALHQAQDIS